MGDNNSGVYLRGRRAVGAGVGGEEAEANRGSNSNVFVYIGTAVEAEVVAAGGESSSTQG